MLIKGHVCLLEVLRVKSVSCEAVFSILDLPGRCGIYSMLSWNPPPLLPNTHYLVRGWLSKAARDQTIPYSESWTLKYQNYSIHFFVFLYNSGVSDSVYTIASHNSPFSLYMFLFICSNLLRVILKYEHLIWRAHSGTGQSADSFSHGL